MRQLNELVAPSFYFLRVGSLARAFPTTGKWHWAEGMAQVEEIIPPNEFTTHFSGKNELKHIGYDLPKFSSLMLLFGLRESWPNLIWRYYRSTIYASLPYTTTAFFGIILREDIARFQYPELYQCYSTINRTDRDWRNSKEISLSDPDLLKECEKSLKQIISVAWRNPKKAKKLLGFDRDDIYYSDVKRVYSPVPYFELLDGATKEWIQPEEKMKPFVDEVEERYPRRLGYMVKQLIP